jgi:hypothetical protein
VFLGISCILGSLKCNSAVFSGAGAGKAYFVLKSVLCAFRFQIRC